MNLSVLINPFDKTTDRKLVAGAILATVIGLIMAYYFNTRYDGVLDVHFAETVSWQQAVMDSLINIVILGSVLYGAALLINRKSRPIDIFITVMIARLTYYILPAFNMDNAMFLAGEKLLASMQDRAFPVISGDMTLIMSFALISIIMMAWYAILLYNGFRVASNGRGAKSVGLTAAAILVAEVLSKIIFILTA